MLSRQLLLGVLLLSLSDIICAQERAYWSFISGYNKLLENKEISAYKAPQGGQIGIGYSFSEDFSIELVGLMYYEKSTPHFLTNSTSQPVSPKTLSLTSQTSPTSNPHQNIIPSSEILFDHPDSISSLPPPNSEKRNSAWEMAAKEIHGDRSIWNGTSSHLEPKPPALPTPEYKALTPPTCSSPTQTSHSETASLLAEDPLAENSSKQPLYWSGIALIGKWTLINFHPRLHMYWASGGLLLPFNQGFLGVMTVGVGIQFKLHKRLTFDISRTITLLKKGPSKIKDSYFSQDKPEFFNISLHWHFYNNA